MKNILKVFGAMRSIAFIALVAVIGFSIAACGDDGGGDPPPPPTVLPMNFTENTGWNAAGHESWCRWNYFHQDKTTNALDKNKAYVLTCSFTSNVDIDELSFEFIIKEPNWAEISNYAQINVPGNVPKNTTYSGKIPLIINSDADLSAPNNIYLYAQIGNRTNATAPILTFSQFSLEAVNKETAGLTKWTVSGKDITVTDTRRTFAENLSSYQGKSNVFHIKPTYNASTYDHFVMEYDLSGLIGKKIGVEMSFDVYINKKARIAWQMLVSPDYPLVCGYIDETYFLSENTWHTLSGNTIVTVPSSGKLYLSGMQINGAEAYFANATLVINEGTSTPDTAVTLNSVTADGSASSKTTQLTLTFSQAITGLTAANINLGSTISGLTKGTLSGSGPTYTLPITGFTAGGSLSVSVSKLGYNITPSKTVTIYGGSGSSGGGDSGEFDNLDGLKDWLNGKGNNTKDNPYKIKIKFPNLTGLLDFLKGLTGKFFTLDLSGITGGIGANAFDGLSNLTGITFPSGINGIGANAFKDCSNLTSVTFNGTIPAGSFDTNAFIGLGDLRDKYLAGGTGTYTRESGGTTWTKQSSGQNDPGDLAGTWTGNIGGYNATVTVSGTGWTMTAPGFYDSGYFVRNGNTATLYLSDGTNNGTATLTNSTTIQVVLNSNTKFPGTYTLTKQSGGGGTAPTITTASLPGGTVGTGYNQTLAATGDTPITWTIDSGTLPAGLSLAATGAISGTPTTAATSTFTVKATNAKGNNTKQLSITIVAGSTLTWTVVDVSSIFGSMSEAANVAGIAYSGSRFVAVAGSGKMAYSDNGTTWTVVTDSKFGTYDDIYSIAYGSNKFVAVGRSGKMAYSSNGTTWTAVADSKFGTSTIRTITYDDSGFVAGGADGKIAFSSDGITWYAGGDSTFGSNTIMAIASKGTKKVAVGSAGKMAYAANALYWTAVGDSKFDTNQITGVACSLYRFVAVGFTKSAYSTDGETWTTFDSNYLIPTPTQGIAYVNNKFITWGGNTSIATSSDGLTWTSAGQVISNENTAYVYCVAWGSNKYVAGLSKGRIAYSSGN